MVEEIKCGIEIHQQLDSHKLFCKCPSILRNDEPKFIVKRKLHAVKGESGEIDVAAKHEAIKDKEFIYQGYDTTCLVELDEEPPHKINKEALIIGLHIALHLNCEIVPITQIMRKTVVDGSNTSGFQRTVLIARNGYVQTKSGKIRISSVLLEEDAARIIQNKTKENSEEKTIYRLDRLGIPLVEISTEPDITSAEQCKEVALFIGDILRSCKVKRGIGTIRQDVNISIKNHPRIEIKGFQEPKMFIKTIEMEVIRQKKLIEINEELKKRKATGGIHALDISEIFNNTNCNIIKNALEKNGKVYGAKLNKFKGIFGTELYPSKRFGTEVSDYAKTSGVNGIIHSDEDLKKYNLTEEEIIKIKDKLKVGNEDLFILVADSENLAKKAIRLAIERANMQILKVSPSEVRADNPDGSTRFLRPMPSSSRMYPETDLGLLKITKDIINQAKKTLPKLKSEIREEFKKKGLSDEMIKLLSQDDKIEEFMNKYF